MIAGPVPRYEFKYVLKQPDIAYIRDRAALFMERDPMGDHGVYDVYSLYLDTWDWLTAHEALEGIRTRFKVRVRTYDPAARGMVFAEIKGRVGTSIIKSRALTTTEQANRLCLGKGPDAPDAKLAEFASHVDRLDLTPRLWVKYKREAWVSPYGCGSRMTFDSELQVQLPDDADPMMPDPLQWSDVDIGGPALLEMKFNGASPSWMHKVVHGAELDRISYSKYTKGAVLHWDDPWATRERDMSWTP